MSALRALLNQIDAGVSEAAEAAASSPRVAELSVFPHARAVSPTMPDALRSPIRDHAKLTAAHEQLNEWIAESLGEKASTPGWEEDGDTQSAEEDIADSADLVVPPLRSDALADWFAVFGQTGIEERSHAAAVSTTAVAFSAAPAVMHASLLYGTETGSASRSAAVEAYLSRASAHMFAMPSGCVASTPCDRTCADVSPGAIAVPRNAPAAAAAAEGGRATLHRAAREDAPTSGILWKMRPVEKTRRGSLNYAIHSLARGARPSAGRALGARDPRVWQRRSCTIVRGEGAMHKHHFLVYTTKAHKKPIDLDLADVVVPSSAPGKGTDGSFWSFDLVAQR